MSKGDEQAFTQLFEYHKDNIYYYALAVTRSEFLAEEITQNVFIKIWQHRLTLPTVDSFPAWMKTVARNEAYNYLKRLAMEKVIVNRIAENIQDGDDSTSATLEWKEFHALVAKAIAQLPEQQRAVYKLSRGQDMSYQQIANALGISINTVKYHMKQALQGIRIYLDAHLLTLAITIYCM
ncbi:RNA polymerase sigma factor [Chitinophaga sp. XS-30]|uniref:RNA polymerase sigma factor n=1 Tax=Chitinophaga sp. XS-30 TaxID=2604421 RepID=UPI0011DDE245|nr:RNA polymerase sigma-70 factor [Chitinophaga sp. XS-30]QEH42455.1 RNA polymerase sigma-70 factor [Chitinophaga sp. XS-30]